LPPPPQPASLAPGGRDKAGWYCRVTERQRLVTVNVVGDQVGEHVASGKETQIHFRVNAVCTAASGSTPPTENAFCQPTLLTTGAHLPGSFDSCRCSGGRWGRALRTTVHGRALLFGSPISQGEGQQLAHLPPMTADDVVAIGAGWSLRWWMAVVGMGLQSPRFVRRDWSFFTGHNKHAPLFFRFSQWRRQLLNAGEVHLPPTHFKQGFFHPLQVKRRIKGSLLKAFVQAIRPAQKTADSDPGLAALLVKQTAIDDRNLCSC
jgi:hypothetical protein